MKSVQSLALVIICLCVLVSCKSWVTVQEKDLYDQAVLLDTNELDGFKAVNIFYDDYDKSIWVSPEKQCVELKTEKRNVFSGSSALNVKWDKIAGGCNWIGIGFGWNNWMAKDILDLSTTAAIQMQVKSVHGSFKNLPVAFALEDYSGIQTYYGFRMELASGEFNDSSWTSVTIPLSKFNFKSPEFDLEKVKQFIIQLEGDGNIYLDNIKVIKLQK